MFADYRRSLILPREPLTGYVPSHVLLEEGGVLHLLGLLLSNLHGVNQNRVRLGLVLGKGV